MSLFEKLKDTCKNNPQTILFAEANDPRIIQAAKYLNDYALARSVLIGGGFEIREMADKLNVSTRGLEIINHKHYKEYSPLISQLSRKKQFRNLSKNTFEILLKDALYFSLTCLEFGKVDIVLAGNMSTMRAIAKTSLQVLGVANNYRRASSFYVLISKDQRDIFAFADCSLNINPSAEMLAEIAISTSERYFQISGQSPKVAFLSFSTKGSAEPLNISKIKQALHIINNNSPSLICDGEIQFDAAVDSLVAEKKGANNILNGKANVFIFPSLDSANIAQKIAEYIGGYLSIGPILQGFGKCVHHLPKSCSVESIINSALLASFLKLKANP